MKVFLNVFLPLCLFLGAQTLLLNLAWWQHGRMLEKENLLAQQTTQQALPPVTELTENNIGRRITLMGTWQNEASVLLLHQPNQGVAGQRLLTPLKTQNGTYLIDRGWQRRQRERTLPTFENTKNNIEIAGTIRPFPTRKGWLQGPSVNTNPTELLFLDPTYIQTDINQTLYIQALTPTHASYEIVLPAQALTPERHAQYRNTWLACSFILLLMFVYVVFRRKSIFKSNTPNT